VPADPGAGGAKGARDDRKPRGGKGSDGIRDPRDTSNPRAAEDLLNRYIDALNRERTPAAHRPGLPLGAENRLYTAARAVKRLRDPEPPSRAFERRLRRNLGTPTATLKRQVGMIKLAAGVVITVLVAVVAFTVYSATREGAISGIIGRLAALDQDISTVGLEAYSGVLQTWSGLRLEVHAAAPAKRLVRYPASGKVIGTDGRIWWTYSPETRVLRLSEEAAALWPGGDRTSVLYYFWTAPALGRYVEDPYYHVSVVGEEEFLGRRCTVVGVKAPPQHRAPGSDRDEYRLWVDSSTGLPLKEGTLLWDGSFIDVAEFVSLDFSPDLDPAIFEPPAPEGCTTAWFFTGDLEDLAARVGCDVRHPGNLPAEARVECARLTLFILAPALAPPALSEAVGWQLSWEYSPRLERPGGLSTLQVRVAHNPPPAFSSAATGDPVVLAPGVTGFVRSQGEVNWTAGGLDYTLSCHGLSSQQLLEMAAAMLPQEDGAAGD